MRRKLQKWRERNRSEGDMESSSTFTEFPCAPASLVPGGRVSGSGWEEEGVLQGVIEWKQKGRREKGRREREQKEERRREEGRSSASCHETAVHDSSSISCSSLLLILQSSIIEPVAKLLETVFTRITIPIREQEWPLGPS